MFLSFSSFLHLFPHALAKTNSFEKEVINAQKIKSDKKV